MSLHIDAKPGQVAKVVIVAGDPDRVSYIAKTYLQNPVLVSDKRGELCYTGTYQSVPVSVMSTGMGVPSMLIYATELYRDYDCDVIIRVGTSGGFLPQMQRYDIVLSQAACHNSAINDHLFHGTFCPIGDFELLTKAVDIAKTRNYRVFVGNTICNDRIYRTPESYPVRQWIKHGILCSEMEGAALYTAAAEFGKKALMATVIMNYIQVGPNGEEEKHLLPEQPGKTMDDAIVLALETGVTHARQAGYTVDCRA